MNRVLKEKDKVRLFRRNEQNKWGEIGKGIVTRFTYNKANEPIFAGVRIFQEGELSDVEQLLPLESHCFRVVKY
jgi:hypothetical protein